MLRLESIQKRLTPLPHPTTAEAPDPTEFILNCPEEFFAELGERVFPVGRGIWLSVTAPIRVDLLALDEAGRPIIVAFESKHQESALNDALLCASLIAQWKAPDFFKLTGSRRSQELMDFLAVDSEQINRSQRVILVSEHYQQQMLATTQWLAGNYGVDISCVEISASWDSQVRRGYLSCHLVFSSLSAPQTIKTFRENPAHGQAAEEPRNDGPGPSAPREPLTVPVYSWGEAPSPPRRPQLVSSEGDVRAQRREEAEAPLRRSETSHSLPDRETPPPSRSAAPVPFHSNREISSQAERFPSTESEASASLANEVPATFRPTETQAAQTADAVPGAEPAPEVTLEVEPTSKLPGRLKWLLLLVCLAVIAGLVYTFSPPANVTTKEPVFVGGVVTDRATGQPVREAALYYAGEQAVTSGAGIFRFAFEPGKGALAVRAAGYRQQEIDSPAAGMSIDLEPLQVRAVYLGQTHLSNPERRARIQKLIEGGSLNAIAIGLKSPEGYLSFPVEHGLAKEIGALQGTPGREVSLDLQRWKREGLYTIAYVALFRDDLLAEKRPDLALKSLESRKPVKDASGMGWTDPALAAVREYNIAVAKAAARAGFDEVQFDFVRYPASKLSAEGTDTEENQHRLKTIVEFLRQAREELQPYNVYLAATVLGSVCSVQTTGFIAQRLEDFAGEVDYVSPMLYPSAFASGGNGPDPLKRSYELVHESLKDAVGRLGGNSVKLRPWLQNFPDSASPRTYPEAGVIRAQIQAALDAEASGWMLWDKTSRYVNTLEALNAAPASALSEEQPVRAEESSDPS